MDKLVKPIDYARKLGISRQAVYAKIKKGILPSRNVDGKIYIVVSEEQENTGEGSRGTGDERKDLLEAKDETIAVLKETIRDLKETNRMITTTLRSEVELLKEAFGEMKTLYAAQIERMDRMPQPLLPEESVATEAVVSETDDEERQTQEAGEWIELAELLIETGISKVRKVEKVYKRAKKLYKKGDGRIEKSRGDYRVMVDADILALLLKR